MITFSQRGMLLGNQIPDFLYFASRVAPNASAQSLTANTVQTINLDTEVYDTGNYGVLSSNQVIIQAGTYFISAKLNLASPSANSFLARAYLYDVTNSKIIAGGQNSSTSSYPIEVEGMITVTAATTIELRAFYGGTATDVQVRLSNEAFTLSTAGIEERAAIKLWRLKETYSQTPIKIGAGNQWTSYAELRNMVALNAAGQSITADTLTTIQLTEETSDNDGIVVLSGNQFTLGAGTYYIEAELTKVMVGSGSGGYAPMYTRIYNTTDGSIALVGATSPGNQQAASGTYEGISGEPGKISGVITLTGSKTFELQAVCDRGGTLGSQISGSLSTANSNCLAQVKIYKR